MFLARFAENTVRAVLKKRRIRYLDNLISKGLKMGKDVQIIDAFFFDPSHCFLISIGDNTVICPNVRLIAHDASTKMILGYTKIGLIDIKDNCFIGDSTIVLPNVTIGPTSIIGAGSVVTKDVPPYSVAAGNPAKVICTVQDYIEKMKVLSSGKNIFGPEYYIDDLDQAGREEIIGSIGDSFGFIV